MKAVFRVILGDKKVNEFMRCMDLFRDGEGAGEERVIEFELKKGTRITKKWIELVKARFIEANEKLGLEVLKMEYLGKEK